MAVRQGRLSPQMRQVVVIWAVVTLVLVVATLVFLPRLDAGLASASERARDYGMTMELFTLLSCPICAMVMVFAFYSLFQWRSRGRPTQDGPYLVAGRGIQVAWVLMSALLVTVLYGWGLVFLNRADAAPPPGSHVLNVDVTGEQWNWNFTYPQYHNAQSAYLEVPLNRPILFTITSVDVTHSFSVPAWALKQDAVPGQWTYIRVTPDHAGKFDLMCYELCGMFHAYMQSYANVVPPAQFASWVQKQPRGYPWGIAGVGYPHSYNEPKTSEERPG